MIPNGLEKGRNGSSPFTADFDSIDFYRLPKDFQLDAVKLTIFPFDPKKRSAPAKTSERVLTYLQSVALRAAILKHTGATPVYIGSRPDPSETHGKSDGSARAGYSYRDRSKTGPVVVNELVNFAWVDGRLAGFYRKVDDGNTECKKVSIKALDFVSQVEKLEVGYVDMDEISRLGPRQYFDALVTDGDVNEVLVYPFERMTLAAIYDFERFAIEAVKLTEMAQAIGLDAKLERVGQDYIGEAGDQRHGMLGADIRISNSKFTLLNDGRTSIQNMLEKMSVAQNLSAADGFGTR